MLTAGIDIGGTQLRVGLFDEDHQMIDFHKTPNDRGKPCEANMEVLLDFLRPCKDRLTGVGIGCPGPMDLKKGVLLHLPNLVGWDGFRIVRYVEDALSLPVVLNDDGNVAGLAEAILGAGKGYDTVAFIGVSTGIGGAFIRQGRIFNGAHANASAFWNMIVNEDPRHHKNASPGSLNEQCSGSGLASAATAYYGRPTDARTLFERANGGDAGARYIVERAADALARGIANITVTLDPEVIVIGGSVAIHNPGYIARAVEIAGAYVLYPPEQLIIKQARFGDDAGMLGASLLVDPQHVAG